MVVIAIADEGIDAIILLMTHRLASRYCLGTPETPETKLLTIWLQAS
jgi:hypothetical protein